MSVAIRVVDIARSVSEGRASLTLIPSLTLRAISGAAPVTTTIAVLCALLSSRPFPGSSFVTLVAVLFGLILIAILTDVPSLTPQGNSYVVVAHMPILWSIRFG